MRIGRVYKIVHNQSDLVYVGSTFNQLRFRFRDHKNHKNKKSHKCVITKYLQKYGVDNFKIMLIKEYNVVDRQHLRAKEQLWINRLKCINQRNCLQLKNKHLQKQRYAENKEHYKEWRSQKIYCDICDVYMIRCNKSRHLKTQKHAKNLALKSEITV